MRYAYVISERMRKIRDFDFETKTAGGLIEYNRNDHLYPDSIHTWEESVADTTSDYASIEELTADFDKEDIIITSDLFLGEIGKMLNYHFWSSSFVSCSKMLKAYSKPESTISLEDLIKEMKK